MNNSLIWKEVLEKLPEELKNRYINLMNNRNDIKYALRTLNILISKGTKEETIKYYKKDLENGNWTIDIVNSPIEIEEYFKEKKLEEFYKDLIKFCEE